MAAEDDMPASQPSNSAAPASASGTVHIADDVSVHRLGFGAMRLTGPGVWGEPPDLDQAKAVLREAVRLGVDFIDTAQAYGPDVSEQLIARALHPYPEALTIATKGGISRRNRDDPGSPDGRPAKLRADCEGSLRRLRLDTIDLWQLHRLDPNIPREDQIGTIQQLRDEGKIRNVGISQVSVDELNAVRALIDVATVQNRYNIADRASDDVLAACETARIAFIAWYPLATGQLSSPTSDVAEAARRRRVTASQLSLAWLLHRSSSIIAIPGTTSIAHLRENCNAALINLTDNELRQLEQEVAASDD